MLHYLKSLYDWLDPETTKTVPIAQTAWAILRDSCHSDLSLRYQAEHIAVAVLYLALQTHGVEVPYSSKAERKWWEVSYGFQFQKCERTVGCIVIYRNLYVPYMCMYRISPNINTRVLRPIFEGVLELRTKM